MLPYTRQTRSQPHAIPAPPIYFQNGVAGTFLRNRRKHYGEHVAGCENTDNVANARNVLLVRLFGSRICHRKLDAMFGTRGTECSELTARDMVSTTTVPVAGPNESAAAPLRVTFFGTGWSKRSIRQNIASASRNEEVGSWLECWRRAVVPRLPTIHSATKVQGSENLKRRTLRKSKSVFHC